MSNELNFEKDIHISIRGTPAEPVITIKAQGTYQDPAGATDTLKETREVVKEGAIAYDPDMTMAQVNAGIVAALKAECGDPS